MKHFKWTRTNKETKRNPPIYESSKEQIFKDYNGQFVKARMIARNNGPNTAFAEIYLTVEWPTPNEQKWGHHLYAHFKGKYAFIKAKQWCDFFLNNPPKGIDRLSEEYFKVH